MDEEIQRPFALVPAFQPVEQMIVRIAADRKQEVIVCEAGDADIVERGGEFVEEEAVADRADRHVGDGVQCDPVEELGGLRAL